MRSAFLAVLVSGTAGLFCLGADTAHGQQPTGALTFAGPEQGEFKFDTGVFRGVLHGGGKAFGLRPVTDVVSGKPVAKSSGWLSPYRILSTGTQHGYAAWDWASEVQRLPDGTVEIRWTADDKYPLNMRAVYRWKAANTADLTVTVTPQKDLPRLELFVASYFDGFPQSSVYARSADGKSSFVPATKTDGVWQYFPRDDEAAKLVSDGRWQHPPAPVTWVVRPHLAGPLAVRRNPELGLTALVMSPAEDCFGVYTPFGEEGHGSIYVGLFGRDAKAGQSVTGRVRLLVGRSLTDEQAVKCYREYAQEPRS